jgi:hypothetical protein
MTRGQVGKMPGAHCPVHNCRLVKARESWLWSLRGKMNRWWAKCVVGYEFYVVRSDGLLHSAPRRKPRKLGRGQKKPGRPATRRSLFFEARGLRSKKRKWADIARILVPQEFKEEPSRAAERLRIGVQNLKKKSKRTA